MIAPLERPCVVLSLDTELIWGYLDCFDERTYERRFPGAVRAHEAVLERLAAASISATWAVVGALSLPGTDGPGDALLAGLPRRWVRRVPAGCETTHPLFYQRSFLERLRQARPAQDIGLHGGLTHLVWRGRRVGIDACRAELLRGIKALETLGVRPRSFVFPRGEQAHWHLLPQAGLLCFRGPAPVLAERVPRGYVRSMLRALQELGRMTPPPVWPLETLPGLYNIPASMSLYPIGRMRTRAVPLRSRLERFRRGLTCAIRARGLFHFWMHPENLCESGEGFALFDDLLEEIVRRRQAGDVEVLNMFQMVRRVQALPPAPLESGVETARP